METPKPADILLVTATPIESQAVYRVLQPIDEGAGIEKTYLGSNTYRVGILGCHRVTHVQSGMGSLGPNASQLTVADAIRDWKPKLVILIGLAFGVDAAKQAIGDVLVGTQVISYEHKRIGKTSKISRADHAPSDVVLLNRFTNQPEWRHAVNVDQPSTIHSGPILSGNLLVDNLKARNDLLKEFPMAIGGEMEGAGLYAAAHRAKTAWIVVKAVCDYADGEKSVDKESRQQTAADAVVSLCQHVFSQKDVFAELDCYDYQKIAETTEDPTYIDVRTDKRLEIVLFERYQKTSAPYYFPRGVDSELGLMVKAGSVWLSGPSGCGKTCALMRQADVLDLKPTLADLSTAIGEDVRRVLFSVYLKLKESSGDTTTPRRAFATIGEAADTIASVACRPSFQGNLILLDEVAVCDNEELASFARSIISVMLSLTNLAPELRPKWGLSTLTPPTAIGEPTLGKVRECIYPIAIDRWKQEDLTALARFLCECLGVNISVIDLGSLVNAADGSPRAIKTILRIHCKTLNSTGWSLGRAIESYLSTTSPA